MRTTTAAWADTIRRPHRIVTEVTSWRSEIQLGGIMVPSSGVITYDARARLRRRVELAFPATGDLIAGVPDDPEHPLAVYGQRLKIRTGVVHPTTGEAELLDQGWYLITGWEWSAAGDSITVRAEDLRRLLDDALLWSDAVTAEALSPSLNYPSQWSSLARAYLPAAQQLFVTTSVDLPTGNVGSGRVYRQDRTTEMDTLAREWGAQWYVQDNGWCSAVPLPGGITPATPADWTLTDGEDGTVIDRGTGADRARFANILQVTGATPPGASGGEPPQTVVLWSDGRGVTDWHGPMGQIIASEDHPTITDPTDLSVWAQQRLVQLVRPAVEHPVTTLPDPAIELDDIGEVITEGTAVLGRVTSIRLPLTHADGAMRLTLSAGDYGSPTTDQEA